MQGDRKNSKAFGKAVTQTGHIFALHSIYSHLPSFCTLKNSFATNGKIIIIIINTWRVLVYERPPNKPGYAAF